jgi:GDYXXLXY protein
MTPAARLIAVLAVPILALMASAWSAARQASTATQWTLPIEGYDPRDPLRGHYIQFRYALGDTVSEAVVSGAWLCLKKPDGKPEVSSVYGNDSASCAARGRILENHDGFATASWGNSATILGRIYIPEADSALLTGLLADTKREKAVRIEVAGNGKVTPVDLLFDGKPWRAYRAAKP